MILVLVTTIVPQHKQTSFPAFPDAFPDGNWRTIQMKSSYISCFISGMMKKREMYTIPDVTCYVESTN